VIWSKPVYKPVHKLNSSPQHLRGRANEASLPTTWKNAGERSEPANDLEKCWRAERACQRPKNCGRAKRVCQRPKIAGKRSEPANDLKSAGERSEPANDLKSTGEQSEPVNDLRKCRRAKRGCQRSKKVRASEASLPTT